MPPLSHLYNSFLLLTIIIITPSCTINNNTKETTATNNPQTTETTKENIDKCSPGINFGIYSKCGNLYIKSNGKSFLSVLDEVARLRRFNYTVLSDISRYYIDYYDIDREKALQLNKGSSDLYLQKKYFSIIDFIDDSVAAIKENYSKSEDPDVAAKARSLRYRLVGDGVIFFSSDEPQSHGYKKLFLYNLSEREVSFYISRLLDIPYAPFSPNRAAELPRRDSTAIQALNSFSANNNFSHERKGGDELQKIEEREWQLSNHLKRDERNDPGLPNKDVRWISIPQQNAIIMRAPFKVLDQVGEILYAIDSDYKQILIEAKVFQYDAATLKKIGIALSSIPGRLEIGQSSGNYKLTIDKMFGPDAANALPADFYYLSAAERRLSLLSALSVYARDATVKVVAEPVILLKPGQVSTIDITQTKLIQPSANITAVNGYYPASFSTPVSVEAGVFFTVRPTLLSDNKIQLDLFLKQSEFSTPSDKNVLVSTSQNQVNTSTIVKDDELVSLGQFQTTRFEATSTGIPGLKDIDYLGKVFGASEEIKTSTHIEFMIKAKVQHGDANQGELAVESKLSCMFGNLNTHTKLPKNSRSCGNPPSQ